MVIFMKYIVTFGIVILISFFASCSIASCSKESLSPPLVDPATEYISETEVSVTWEFATTEEQATTQSQPIGIENKTEEVMLFSKKFILKETPKDDEWLKYKDSPIVEVVKKTDDTFDIVIDAVHKYSPVKIYSVSDGYFVGYNGGEFIGGLMFIFDNVDYSELHWLGEDKVAGFYELNNDKNMVYYLNGYSHLITSGYINRIIKENGIWKIDEDFNLVLGEYNSLSTKETDVEVSMIERQLQVMGNYPGDFIVEDDIVYINTGMKLFMVKDEQVFKLAENFYWGINSLVYIDGKLYLGMRGGIASYNLETGDLLWYEKVSEGE